jgi:hypothetical protein
MHNKPLIWWFINQRSMRFAMQMNDTIEKTKTQFATLNSKTVEIAEENTKAAFAFTREALAARTPEALWSIQQSFFKSQQDAITKQAESFGKFYADWLKDSAAPMAQAMKPFMPNAA